MSSRQISLRSPAVWIFLLTLAVRLLVLTRLGDSAYLPSEEGDMKFYHSWALRILDGHWTDHKAFYGLPGYAWLLAGVYSVTGVNPFIVGFLQACSEAGIAVLIFQTLRLLCGETCGIKAGWIAALGWVFYQPAQTFSAVLMPTTWLVLAFWGVVYWALSTRRASPWHPWFAIGALIGLVATMIATILFVIPLVVAAIFLRWEGRTGSALSKTGLQDRQDSQILGPASCKSCPVPKNRPSCLSPRFAAVALLLAGVLAGTAPCWIHNRFIAKEPVFLSAHGGINFYIGNNPVADGYPTIPAGLRTDQAGLLQDSIRLAEQSAGRPLGLAEVSRFWSAKATGYIVQNPGAWARLLALKLRNAWNRFQYDDLVLIEFFDVEGILTPGLRFGLIAALAIPGMFLVRIPGTLWITTAVWLHIASLMPVFITERYRLAAVPGLLMLAAIGIGEFQRFVVQKRWQAACLYIGGTALGVLLVFQPIPGASLWPVYYNVGIKTTASGNLAVARQNLEAAHALTPDDAEVNFALGNLWLKLKQRDQAKAFYRRTIILNPKHASAFNNLGVLALEENRWELADAFLSRSAALEPEDAKTHFLIAQVKAKLGDKAAAMAAIDQALALEPKSKPIAEFKQRLSAP